MHFMIIVSKFLFNYLDLYLNFIDFIGDNIPIFNCIIPMNIEEFIK